jgi:hypothetical protein
MVALGTAVSARTSGAQRGLQAAGAKCASLGGGGAWRAVGAVSSCRAYRRQQQAEQFRF